MSKTVEYIRERYRKAKSVELEESRHLAEITWRHVLPFIEEAANKAETDVEVLFRTIDFPHPYVGTFSSTADAIQSRFEQEGFKARITRDGNGVRVSGWDE